jgi:hypothetical protein
VLVSHSVDAAAIFATLPRRVRPDRPIEDLGVVHFVLSGAERPHWSVTLRDGQCRVEEGLVGSPVCTVTMPEAVFVAVETGQCDPVGEFIRGRIKVTNVGKLRRYDRIFYRFFEDPSGSGSAKG